MADTLTQEQTRTSQQPDTDRPWLWNVVLLDDDEHSYEYVIKMARELFGHSVERAFQIAQTVDAEGRAVLRTTHRELAELKRDQVHAYGRDGLIATCVGSMSAVLEPAEHDDDGGRDDDAA